MFIVRVIWNGAPGLPGYTNLAFNSTLGGQPASSIVTAAEGAVHTWASSLQNYIAPGVELDVQQGVRVIDPVTGVLTGLVNADSAQPVVNSNATSSGFVGGAGAVEEWHTGSIVGGRLLTGRTFIVPMNAQQFFQGRLTSACQTALQTGANQLITDSAAAGAALGVWGRPRKAYTNRKGVLLPARAGSFGVVSSVSVPATNALLRSRRD